MTGAECKYLGHKIETIRNNGIVYDRCQCNNGEKYADPYICSTCKRFERADSRSRLVPQPARLSRLPVEKKRHPDGVCVSTCGDEIYLGDVYRGASAFLILGGPSTKEMRLDLLNQRGCCLLSYNNNPAVLPWPMRPHIWLHTDPARKFHDSFYRDPSILKFVPVREWGAGRDGDRCVRTKIDGEFQNTKRPAREFPGVIGFQRTTTFTPETYLTEDKICRGNDKQHAEGVKCQNTGKWKIRPNGWPNCINTMFAAVRLAHYLGFATLYLVGADFRMEPDNPYGFDQGKSDGGCRSNNAAFQKMNVMFAGLKPHFDASKFNVMNCTPNSGLQAFEYIKLEDAIDAATAGISQELDCRGWYDPIDGAKEDSGE